MGEIISTEDDGEGADDFVGVKVDGFGVAMLTETKFVDVGNGDIGSTDDGRLLNSLSKDIAEITQLTKHFTFYRGLLLHTSQKQNNHL